jgi:hypothetical protein
MLTPRRGLAEDSADVAAMYAQLDQLQQVFLLGRFPKHRYLAYGQLFLVV